MVKKLFLSLIFIFLLLASPVSAGTFGYNKLDIVTTTNSSASNVNSSEFWGNLPSSQNIFVYNHSTYTDNNFLKLDTTNDPLTGNLNITANLTVSKTITFLLGEFIDNIVDGWIRVNGNLNVTDNLVADNITANSRIGIGTPSPTHNLDIRGNASITGNLTIQESITNPQQNIKVFFDGDGALGVVK